MAEEMTGQCLCGKVRFKSKAVHEVGACHCDMCRRWCGGPGIAVHVKDKPAITGEENLTWFKSSDWAARGFCSTCGSNLFYRLELEEPEYVVFAGAYHDQSAFELKNQIFIDEKPAYYDFAGDIPSMTGEEVFAMYGAGNDAGDREST
ncbi:MAG: GFA family protein [Rhodospirillales bacterium]